MPFSLFLLRRLRLGLVPSRITDSANEHVADLVAVRASPFFDEVPAHGFSVCSV
jgi:hypothetical protein